MNVGDFNKNGPSSLVVTCAHCVVQYSIFETENVSFVLFISMLNPFYPNPSVLVTKCITEHPTCSVYTL